MISTGGERQPHDDYSNTIPDPQVPKFRNERPNDTSPNVQPGTPSSGRTLGILMRPLQMFLHLQLE